MAPNPLRFKYHYPWTNTGVLYDRYLCSWYKWVWSSLEERYIGLKKGFEACFWWCNNMNEENGQPLGLKGAKAVLKDSASAWSSASDNMHTFQSSRFGMSKRETKTCLRLKVSRPCRLSNTNKPTFQTECQKGYDLSWDVPSFVHLEGQPWSSSPFHLHKLPWPPRGLIQIQSRVAYLLLGTLVQLYLWVTEVSEQLGRVHVLLWHSIALPQIQLHMTRASHTLLARKSYTWNKCQPRVWKNVLNILFSFLKNRWRQVRRNCWVCRIMCDGNDKHMPSARHPELIIYWASRNNLAFWQGDVAFGANCNN